MKALASLRFRCFASMHYIFVTNFMIADFKMNFVYTKIRALGRKEAKAQRYFSQNLSEDIAAECRRLQIKRNLRKVDFGKLKSFP